MEYFKNLALSIFGIEGIFIIAFIGTLALFFELKTKITKKEGWDKISVGLLLIISAIFIGIYFNYKYVYIEYKNKQKIQWQETTKNWTEADWKNYESQKQEQDYQCVSGSCHDE